MINNCSTISLWLVSRNCLLMEFFLFLFFSFATSWGNKFYQWFPVLKTRIKKGFRAIGFGNECKLNPWLQVAAAKQLKVSLAGFSSGKSEQLPLLGFFFIDLLTFWLWEHIFCLMSDVGFKSYFYFDNSKFSVVA